VLVPSQRRQAPAVFSAANRTALSSRPVDRFFSRCRPPHWAQQSVRGSSCRRWNQTWRTIISKERRAIGGSGTLLVPHNISVRAAHSNIQTPYPAGPPVKRMAILAPPRPPTLSPSGAVRQVIPTSLARQIPTGAIACKSRNSQRQAMPYTSDWPPTERAQLNTWMPGKPRSGASLAAHDLAALPLAPSPRP
jgi:hypothetical protein